MPERRTAFCLAWLTGTKKESITVSSETNKCASINKQVFRSTSSPKLSEISLSPELFQHPNKQEVPSPTCVNLINLFQAWKQSPRETVCHHRSRNSSPKRPGNIVPVASDPIECEPLLSHPARNLLIVGIEFPTKRAKSLAPACKLRCGNGC